MEEAIAQEDSFGCSIACVASITGVNYKTAKSKYFKNSNDANTVGYWCRDLVRVLGKRKYSYKYLKKSMPFRNGTIVFIKRSKRYPAGHYLAKTKKGWMDPWINFDANKIEIRKARAGFRKKLPGKPIYAVFQV